MEIISIIVLAVFFLVVANLDGLVGGSGHIDAPYEAKDGKRYYTIQGMDRHNKRLAVADSLPKEKV